MRHYVRRFSRTERTLLTELWELVWAGHVTNDAWQPLRSGTTLRLLPAPVDGARPSRFSVIAPPPPKPVPRKRTLMEWIFGRIAG